MHIDLIIMALVAVFILLRLRSELGTTDNMEDMEERFKNRRNPYSDHNNDSQDQQPSSQGGAPIGRSDHILHDVKAEPQKPEFEPAVQKGLEAIYHKDRNFNPNQFLDGANGAYPMILEAFWKGDKEILRNFLSNDVYGSFASVIDGRDQSGVIVGNRFLDLNNSSIVEAHLMDTTAEISVKFEAEIIAVTMDSEKNIIEGDASDSVNVNDIWTFQRNVKSREPNWTLTGTRSE